MHRLLLRATIGLLLSGSAAHAEFGATATLLQPSRERGTGFSLAEGPLSSRVDGGSGYMFFGAVGANAGTASEAGQGALWNMERIRFGELQSLATWEVKYRWDTGALDQATSTLMGGRKISAVGGWVGRLGRHYVESAVGNGEMAWYHFGPGEFDPLTGPVESLEGKILPVLWDNGTPVNLLPKGTASATVTSIFAGLQAGQALIGDRPSAVIWQGTAASMSDVTPPAAAEAGIAAITGGWQAGYVVLPPDSGRKAALWQGSAATFRNVHPEGATASWLLGAHSNRFVGAAVFGGQTRAGLWTQANAGSFVNLHPSGYVASEATATRGDFQIGSVTTNDGGTHAAFWNGTARSFLDLHPALPPGYTQSEAKAIIIMTRDRYYVSFGGGGILGPMAPGQGMPRWTINGSGGWDEIFFPGATLVGGRAFNAASGQWEAVMWKVQELEPPALQAAAMAEESGKSARGAGRQGRGFSVGLTSRIIVRVNGKRRVVRGGDFVKPVRVATSRGRVLRSSAATFAKFRVTASRSGARTVVVTASGPGGRSRPLRLTGRR